MHCLRCGLEIDSPAVFCETCLDSMPKDDVSRETPPVVIQPHPEFEPMKPRPKKPEELLAQANNRNHRLRNICAWLILLCLVLGAGLGLSLFYRDKKPVIGQNYTTVVDNSNSAPHEIPSSN